MVTMKKPTRILIMELLVWPVFVPLYIVLKGLNRILFAWWMNPWLQRRNNQALWDDVQANLYFLYSKGNPLKENRPKPLPFDFASVYLIFENLRFCFTRGRDELHISISPIESQKEEYLLEIIIAALDSKDITEVSRPRSLAEAGDLLRARLDDIKRAFSEAYYPEFKEKLSKVKQDVQWINRQLEWELNKRLAR